MSSHVVIILGEMGTWLYDAGNGDEVLQEILKNPKPYNIVLSHFHPDHIANVNKIPYEELYVSRNTYRYTHAGTIVEEELQVDNLRIFPFPSTHARGSLGMEVDEEYILLGDGLYGGQKQGRRVYNRGLLREAMKLLKELRGSYVLLSHADPFILDKEDVIRQLENFLERSPRDPFIPY